MISAALLFNALSVRVDEFFLTKLKHHLGMNAEAGYSQQTNLLSLFLDSVVGSKGKHVLKKIMRGTF